MWIAKNNDLIILAKGTREELEASLGFMVYTDIEETEIDYQLYNGKYLTPEEIEEQEKQRRNQEIDSKIAELQEMCLLDVIQGNKENVKIYRDVIENLKECKN